MTIGMTALWIMPLRITILRIWLSNNTTLNNDYQNNNTPNNDNQNNNQNNNQKNPYVAYYEYELSLYVQFLYVKP
jgi:hypothetical protein